MAKSINHLVGLIRGNHDINIANRRAHPAQAARRFDLFADRAARFAQCGHQLLRERPRSPQQDARARFLAPLCLDAREDFLLGLGAETGQIAQLSGAYSRFQRNDIGDIEILPESHDRFGTDARNRHQLEKTGRNVFGDLFVIAHVPGAKQFVHLLGNRLADAADRPQVFRIAGPDVLDIAPQVLDGVRRAAIGDHLENRLALQFQYIGDAVKQRRDLLIRPLGF